MKTQIFVMLIIVLVINICMSATDYFWDGPDNGLWSEPLNWAPNGTPGTDAADTVQINAAPDTTMTIVADVSCSVQSVTTSGHVVLRGKLDSTGRPEITLDNVITNSDFLDIWNMNLKGQITNQSDALMKLREIRGSVELENEGELRWYFINILDDASFMTNHDRMNVVDPGALVSYGSMLNTGNISISFSNLAFEAGATLVNEGGVYGAGALLLLESSLVNSGTISSAPGDLLVVSTGDTINGNRSRVF